MNGGDIQGDADAQTRSERWAACAAAHVSGPFGALVALAIAVLFAVEAVVYDDMYMWGFVATLAFVALMYWERGGTKRLLARRDREIESLRSGERSA